MNKSEVKIPKIVRADLLIAESKNLYIFTTSKEISCFLILISHRCLKKFHSFAVLRASQIQQKKLIVLLYFSISKIPLAIHSSYCKESVQL